MPPRPAPIVGIDLGTTNSLVAVCDERGPRVIPDDQGRALLPSVVRLRPEGNSLSVTLGHEAKTLGEADPVGVFASIKRLMGRSRADVADDLPYLPYEVFEGEQNTARVRIPTLHPSSPYSGRLVSPQEISAHILRELKNRASSALGAPVTRAVITVPAYFDDAQRQATRDAGRLAGLEVVRIVAEPTAAALAYGLGLDRDSARNRTQGCVVVYDLGGGTFDVSVLRLTPAESAEGTSFFEVLATSGDTHLGGDDVDHLLVGLAAGGAELTPADRARLKAAAEAAKIALSDGQAATISATLESGAHVSRYITRAEFETLIGGWIDRTISCCTRAVRDALRRLDVDGPLPLDAVVLVGGSTRIPMVRRRVAEHFGMEPYTALDPDQVVALGASVQASILAGETRGSLLLDVIPLSLGLETKGGAVAKLIMRNSTVPARATEMFSTGVDGQTAIKFSVLQGEREMAADCRSLGQFELRGLPPMPAGIPQVEVEFLVDANGVLNVTAHERRSGKRAALQVIPNHGLTREEVARIESESIAHAREDMDRHRVVDLVVNSKLDLKWISERFERFREKLEPAYAAELEGKLGVLRSFVSAAETDWRTVDPNGFHRAKEDLDRASVRLQEIGIAESLRGA